MDHLWRVVESAVDWRSYITVIHAVCDLTCLISVTSIASLVVVLALDLLTQSPDPERINQSYQIHSGVLSVDVVM